MKRERIATTALVVLGVGVVGAAVVDSLRKSDEPARKTKHVHVAGVRDVQLPGRAVLAARLRHERVSGVLYFVDRSCRLHALRLPALVASPAPRNGGCRALVSPAVTPPGWSLWPRDTPIAARCENRRVIVSPSVGSALPMIGGCAPAWRPDGSITYIRRGAIVQFPRTGRAEVLRSSGQLAEAIERQRGTGGWQVAAVAWLSPTRFAVLARAGRRSSLLIFSGRRITAATANIPPSVTELRASPRGTYVVLRSSWAGQLLLYDIRRKQLRPVRAFGAIAWSNDERWVARAALDRVVLRRGRKRLTLPLRAVDLAWTRGRS